MGKFIISSYGCCGTTYLTHFLIRKNLSYIDSLHLKHNPFPPVGDIDYKVAYVYGNPMNVVISSFNRTRPGFNFPRLQSTAIRGPLPDNITVQEFDELTAIPEDMTFEKFLSKEHDYFRFEWHLDNWVNSKTSYPILFIRYETLGDHVAEVMRYFEVDEYDDFEFIARKSNYKSQPAGARDILVRMYGSLWEKIQKMPPVYIKQPEVSA